MVMSHQRTAYYTIHVRVLTSASFLLRRKLYNKTCHLLRNVLITTDDLQLRTPKSYPKTVNNRWMDRNCLGRTMQILCVSRENE